MRSSVSMVLANIHTERYTHRKASERTSMSRLPRLLGFQVIDVTTGEPTRGYTEILSEEVAIRDLLEQKSHSSPDMWVMSGILEGQLDEYVSEHGPIRLIQD